MLFIQRYLPSYLEARYPAFKNLQSDRPFLFIDQNNNLAVLVERKCTGEQDYLRINMDALIAFIFENYFKPF